MNDRHLHADAHRMDVAGRRRRGQLALFGFLAVAAFLLFTEHRAHAAGVLLYGALLLCPLLHLFMHRGHGGGHRHGSGAVQEGPGQGRSRADGLPAPRGERE